MEFLKMTLSQIRKNSWNIAQNVILMLIEVGEEDIVQEELFVKISQLESFEMVHIGTNMLNPILRYIFLIKLSCKCIFLFLF